MEFKYRAYNTLNNNIKKTEPIKRSMESRMGSRMEDQHQVFTLGNMKGVQLNHPSTESSFKQGDSHINIFISDPSSPSRNHSRNMSMPPSFPST